jgi:polysaccharide biosynthesis transport protein
LFLEKPVAAPDSTPHVPAPRLFGADQIPESRGGALAPTAPPGLTASPDAMSLLKALRRRWFLALCLGVLMAGATGALAWFLLPARYTAFSLLRVSSVVPGFFDRQEGDAKFSTVVRTIAGTIQKNRQVHLRALSKDEVRHLRSIKRHPTTLNALTWLEENMKVDFGDGSEYITVRLSGDEPEELVIIVNAIVNS